MTRAFIPVDQLEEGHALILGTTGSGKTYRLRGFLEQLRRADRRVGAVDKLGNHWGLTLDAGGNQGLDFVIFGGKRGHVPMTPADGDRLGRLFVERNIPAIFDVSQWHSDDQEEWIAAFADAVFTTNDAALHLAFDEAQSWVPQGGGGDAFKAVRRLAEQGRGNGIRLLLSCQRLSRLDATVRGMMHTVTAMRQPGVIDRQPDRHWLLWLGRAFQADYVDLEDIGLELAPGHDGKWFCWFRSDAGSRYGRFLHIRHLRTQGELLALIAGITGRPFHSADVFYGGLRTSEDAARFRQEADRLDRRLRKSNPWPGEKDASAGGALPEDLPDTRSGGRIL